MIRAATVASVLLLALGAPVASWAQEGQACSWGIGAAGNTSPAGRDWDLSTPESYWSLSPVVSQQCQQVGPPGRFVPWTGVAATPTLQHRYRAIGERGTLGAIASFGLDWQFIRRFRAGPLVATNMTAWGAGVRAAYTAPPKNRLGLYGAEVRLQWMSGINPDYQAFLLVHVHHRWAGWWAEGEYLPEHRRQVERRTSVATGFEIGQIVGWRFEFRPGRLYGAPELGVRVGVLSNLFADAAVQPVGLGYADIPIQIAEGAPQVELSGGVTRRDGKWVPLGGVAAQLDPADSPLQWQLGLLVGGGERTWASVDGSMAWLW